jgi:hypothetical protein
MSQSASAAGLLRTGRSTIDELGAFEARLGLDAASSFVVTPGESAVLVSDVARRFFR